MSLTFAQVEWRRMERDAARGKPCPYCAKQMSRSRPPTHDHVHPRFLGGSDERDNLLVVCRQCNGDKGCLTLGEFYGALLYEGDERAAIVGMLIEDAAEFDVRLGAQLYADAGLEQVRRKRSKRPSVKVRAIKVAAPEVQHFIDEESLRASDDQVERERIVVEVTERLGIARECWSLSDKAKQFAVLIGGQTVRMRVRTAEQMEDAIVIARLRIERDRVDARPKIYIPRLYGEHIQTGAPA